MWKSKKTRNEMRKCYACQMKEITKMKYNTSCLLKNMGGEYGVNEEFLSKNMRVGMKLCKRMENDKVLLILKDSGMNGKNENFLNDK